MSHALPPRRRTRIKFCGITREQDALAAAALGVDAIGLVFHPPSPRHVEADAAAALVRALPPFVARVGLFVDAPAGFVDACIERVGLDLLQFHGEETAADCVRHRLPYIKAFRVRPGMDLGAAVAQYSAASGVLLDAYHPRLQGGTGAVFDWSLVPPGLDVPVVLAGGLNPDNVQSAIAGLRPYAVDVSGGIEGAKGIKSAAAMAAFVEAVERADHECSRHPA